jgi:hypothetical protein
MSDGQALEQRHHFFSWFILMLAVTVVASTGMSLAGS